ncbi:MAG TPA: hypothetical protein VF322_15465 [Gammaproteobacteria bacterium]
MSATVLAPIEAVCDDRLRAVVDRLVPLRYTAGAPAGEDLAGHVRSASAIRRLGTRLVVVQDDTNALAVLDADGGIRPLLLPRGPDGRRRFDDTRGNKHLKLDLEACAALPDGRLVAFGSGASAARETLVVVEPDEAVRLVHAPGLYRNLRAETAFAGTELNVEGAVVRGAALLLFQRATGAAERGHVVNAVGTLPLGPFLDWLERGGEAPAPSSVTPVELGRIDGVRLGFTDAALLPDGRIAVLACAERSADALSDGPVVGCRCGLLAGAELRTTDVLDTEGRPTWLKLEGIEPGLKRGELHVVADPDRPEDPSRLGRLRLQEAAR